MRIATFELERNQSLWENDVELNLTESGLHAYSLRELLTPSETDEMLSLSLGYGYTNGRPDLRARIGELYGMSGENVLITNGSAEANFVAMWSLIEPGDEIVYMVPNYMQIHGIAEALGARVLPWQLRESLGWQGDLDELAKLVNNRTRAIVLCNPNNPTGAALPIEAMKRIAAIAAKYGCIVHCDEIYRGSELEGEEGASFAEHYENTLVASGLSKALGFPGLRIGWIAGPAQIVEECWRRHDYTTISTGILSQYAATRILAPGKREALLARGRAHLRANLALVVDWLAHHVPRLRMIPPRAGGMAFIGYDYRIGSSALADRLRQEESVFVVAGDWFGMDGFIRLGIGVERGVLEAGLARIDRVLRALAAT